MNRYIPKNITHYLSKRKECCKVLGNAERREGVKLAVKQGIGREMQVVNTGLVVHRLVNTLQVRWVCLRIGCRADGKQVRGVF